jgi:uncharacterized repeat protein (TIGR01451 family)
MERGLRRCLAHAAGVALVALAAAFAPAGALAQGGVCTPPAIDGSLQDMIDFALCVQNGCGHVITDDPQDVCVTDGLVNACTPLVACAGGGVGYFVNGADATQLVAAFDASTGITYVGVRTVGQIGDADGDGNDFIGGTCDGTNILDQDGIGANENYTWAFDFDCDGSFGEVSNNEPIISDAVDVQNVVEGATSFDYVGPSGGTDLEVSVAGLNLPAIWRVRLFIGFTFDGVSEDLSISPLCPEPNLDLDAELTCPGPLCPGGTGTVSATVTNNSEVALANVSLNITLPVGLSFVGVTDSDGWDNCGPAVICSEASLGVGASQTVEFTVQAANDCAGLQNISALASGSFSQPGCVELSGTQGTASCDVDCSGNPTCEITGNDVICDTETSEFCGPAGLPSYSWTGPGGFTSSDQCTGPIDVAGQYNLTVATAQGCESSCNRTLTVEPCEQICCWMTSGGFLNGGSRSGPKDNTFGGNVGPPPHGSWQHIQRQKGGGHDILFNFHSHNAEVLACFDTGDPDPCHPAGEADSIFFGGPGKYSIGNGPRTEDGWFRAVVADNGEPGGNGHTHGCGYPDYYAIWVYSDENLQNLVFSAGQPIDGGNLQVRDCRQGPNSQEFSAAVTNYINEYNIYHNDSEALTGIDLGYSDPELFKPIPNPFTGSTRMAYAVGGSVSSQVEISVYNTSGQKVRTLVSAAMSPGRYETTWDGRDSKGVSVPAGVYFYRSVVGDESTVTRVVYMK